MAEAGAVGGITPVAPAGPQDGGAKAAVPHPEAAAADGKSSAPPLANTSGRAPPETAVVLSATLAGLKPGQELGGTLRRLPGQLLTLLTTPQGDFLLDAPDSLPPDTPVTLVLTRTDRSIAALIIAVGGNSLDVPRPVQLTLVSLPAAPDPAATPDGAPAPPAPPRTEAAPLPPGTGTAPAPAQAPAPAATPSPATAAPSPAAPPPAPPSPAPTPPPAAMTSLLPGETISLWGSGHLPLPATPAPSAHPNAAPPAAPPAAPRMATPAPPLPGASVPPSLPGPLPATPLQTTATVQPDPLAALFDRGVMQVALHTGAPNAPAKPLAASLLATTPAGETSPLTHPPAQSPLARLAENGRLITATVLPQQPAPAPSAVSAQSNPPQPAQPLPETLAAQPSARPAMTPPAATPGQSAGVVPASPAAAPIPAASGQTAAGVELPAGQSATPHQAAPQGPAPASRPAPLPASGTPAMPAAAPVSRQSAMPAASPAPQQPVQLGINGTTARIELPAGAPTPPPGTQLVFLVASGHEAVQALRTAQPQQPQPQPQAQVQEPAAGQPQAQAPVQRPAEPHAQPAPAAAPVAPEGKPASASPAQPAARTDTPINGPSRPAPAIPAQHRTEIRPAAPATTKSINPASLPPSTPSVALEGKPATASLTQPAVRTDAPVNAPFLPFPAPPSPYGTKTLPVALAKSENCPPVTRAPAPVPVAPEGKPAPRTDAPFNAPSRPAPAAAETKTPATNTPGTPHPSEPDTAAPVPPPMTWVPGMALPASVQPAARPLSGGEALLMAVMQALGRKGFTVTPRNAPTPESAADGPDDLAALPAFERMASTAAKSAARAAAARTPETALPSSGPEALPLPLTLQTPQGQIPLVFLVWQQVRDDEEKSGSTGNGGEPEVCFAVEVEFESIGRLRLRGTVGQKHLNLGVETERPLGTALEQAASRDFTQALEAGGMTGSLVFRFRVSE